jgi:hypothetical protein
MVNGDRIPVSRMMNGDRIPVSRTEDNLCVYDDGKISFRPNPCDPGGYDVRMKNGAFYLPGRILPELTRKDVTTQEAFSSLENFQPGLRDLIRVNDIEQDELYIAMLKVRNLELEDMLNRSLSNRNYNL